MYVDTPCILQSGSSAADLEALNPDLIGYVQLCGASLKLQFGELPLGRSLPCCSPEVVIGLEARCAPHPLPVSDPASDCPMCVEGVRRLLAVGRTAFASAHPHSSKWVPRSHAAVRSGGKGIARRREPGGAC